MSSKQIQIESLVNILKGKTNLQGKLIWGMAGRWMNSFGFNFCSEIFLSMPDLKNNVSCVPYITKILQYELVKRNPQPMRELTSLAQGMNK